jgi:hypothetical protein
MTETTSPPHQWPAARLRRSLLPWRAVRITFITELTQPVRYVPQLTMVATQLALTWWLWRALSRRFTALRPPSRVICH